MSAAVTKPPEHMNQKIKLNDGYEIPAFGLGVYLAEVDGDCERAVTYALRDAGYRLIDTAQLYKNEEDVGRGIKKSGVPRDQIYVVTKLLNHGYEECKRSFAESLRKLGTDYVDLFLIHNPVGGKNLESYDAMVELQKSGLIRSIGVSNFNVHHLEALREAGRPTPAVNQIELHAYYRQTKLVDYCRRHGIVVMGFTPLTRGLKFNDPPLKKIAEKHGRSVAHVLLRWSVQNGYITIPKSTAPHRILDNSKVFDFELTPEDIEEMATFPEEKATPLNINAPWEG